jgi:hypothetical protein
LGGLAISLFYQNKNIQEDMRIKKGIEWLIKNFSVSENPPLSTSWLYYYLYALERAGTFLNTESFGKDKWYILGAQYLLREQKQDGSWNNGNIQDTCFAILFLRRATKPFKIVITGEKDGK